ncbi:unnamed protein product [Discosporangium mesarthrocarpum]
MREEEGLNTTIEDLHAHAVPFWWELLRTARIFTEWAYRHTTTNSDLDRAFRYMSLPRLASGPAMRGEDGVELLQSSDDDDPEYLPTEEDVQEDSDSEEFVEEGLDEGCSDDEPYDRGHMIEGESRNSDDESELSVSQERTEDSEENVELMSEGRGDNTPSTSLNAETVSLLRDALQEAHLSASGGINGLVRRLVDHHHLLYLDSQDRQRSAAGLTAAVGLAGPGRAIGSGGGAVSPLPDRIRFPLGECSTIPPSDGGAHSTSEGPFVAPSSRGSPSPPSPATRNPLSRTKDNSLEGPLPGLIDQSTNTRAGGGVQRVGAGVGAGAEAAAGARAQGVTAGVGVGAGEGAGVALEKGKGRHSKSTVLMGPGKDGQAAPRKSSGKGKATSQGKGRQCAGVAASQAGGASMGMSSPSSNQGKKRPRQMTMLSFSPSSTLQPKGDMITEGDRRGEARRRTMSPMTIIENTDDSEDGGAT